MSNQLPAIGSTGVFRVRAPFTIETVNYTCTQISQINTLIEDQVDVFGLYYAPNGLTQTVFQTAIDSNIAIVTLESDNGPTLHIPSDYIDTMPIVPFVPYSRIVLSLDLGFLPDTVNLTQLQTDLAIVANNSVNFSTAINIHSVSTKAVPQEEHVLLEAARLEKLSNYISIYKGKMDADARIAAYETKIRLLEQTVITQKAIIDEIG